MQTTNRRTPDPRRQGAALIEGIIAVSGVALGLLLMGGLHRATSRDLQAIDRARELAWTEALKGCPSEGGFDVGAMVRGLAHGELPIPNAFLPTKESAGTGEKPSGKARVVRIPCNSAASRTEQPSPGWVAGIFGHQGIE